MPHEQMNGSPEMDLQPEFDRHAEREGRQSRLYDEGRNREGRQDRLYDEARNREGRQDRLYDEGRNSRLYDEKPR